MKYPDIRVGRFFLQTLDSLATKNGFVRYGVGQVQWLLVLQLGLNPQPFPLLLKINSWLVGCFGFNDPLRQYFSLYRAVSQREGERGEKG